MPETDGEGEKKEKLNHEEEVKKVKKFLDPDEKVLAVVRQSRIAPGGSGVTPNTIFATDRKLLIRSPTMLGLKEEVLQIPYRDITAVNLEKGIFSSEVSIMAPGLTSDISKFLKPTKKGMPGITAVPTDEAIKLVKIIEQGKSGLINMGGTGSPYDELKKLKELLDQGAITQAEFDVKKRDLLARI
jgi:hypothetical protein